MNILPKKKWHVRTKENMARVRRDEAKAAAEEQSRNDRVKLAEQEDRVNRLKRNTGVVADDPLALSAEEYEKHASSSTHVNFFAEIEAQERKNFSHGNAEYQAEKKTEHNDWESKMGIMKRFAEDTHDLSGESYWWQKIERVQPEQPPTTTDEKPDNSVKRKSEKELRRELKRKLKSEQKKKKKQRRRSSSSSSSDSKQEAKKRRVEKLRQERLERERAEQRRTVQLLNPKVEPSVAAPAPLDSKSTRPKYSDQFNPEFVRRR